MSDQRLISVAAFVKRHVKRVHTWKRKALLDWLQFYWGNGYMGVVTNGPKIVAIALCRPLNDIKDAETPYKFSETGRIVWVDEIVSRHELGILYLFGHAIRRFGPRETFAGLCLSRDGELRMLPWNAVKKLTMDTDNNGLTLTPRATGGTGLRKG